MAPRKQVKQAAAKSTLAAANGNVTSPKKKKTTAKSAEEANIKAAPGKTRVKALQETAVFSPKMLRSKVKNVAEPTKTAVPKTDAAGISKGKAVANKRQRVNNNIAEEEEEEEEVVEKKKRGKTAIKDTKSKTTAKAPVARKRKSETEDQVKDPAQNGEVIHEENPPVAKRATRAKTGEEKNVTPATTKRAKVVQKPPAKKSRNVETKVPAETDDVASKKPRKGMKKTAKVTAKERSPKDSAKAELALSEEEETEITKEQNEEDAIEGDKLKTNMKNSKKAIFKGKRNVETKENSDVQEKEAVIPEVEENGGGEIPQIVESKQKKKNTGKASAAMNEKIEVKKREKKRQTVVTSINEKQETKDIVEKDETTRTMNLTFDSLDEINISPKDISLNNDNNSQEENNEVESTETVKDTQKIKIEFPNNELQRSSSFLRFD